MVKIRWSGSAVMMCLSGAREFPQWRDRSFRDLPPDGQIIWALADGGEQDEINLQIARFGDVFDLLAELSREYGVHPFTGRCLQANTKRQPRLGSGSGRLLERGPQHFPNEVVIWSEPMKLRSINCIQKLACWCVSMCKHPYQPMDGTRFFWPVPRFNSSG